MLNLETNKFEVHVNVLKGTTFGIEIPYPELDARTITLLRESMEQDARKVAAEVARNNKKIDQQRIDGAYDKAGYKTKGAIKWADNHPSKQETPKELFAE